MSTSTSSSTAARRPVWWALAAIAGGLLVWQILTAHGGTPDPTDASTNLSRGSVVINSGLLVLREGLETILVLAAVTASMRGGNGAYRRPVAIGGTVALAASVATWFVAIAITASVGAGSLDLQAATGLLAVAVLLVVMNWFFHRVYWTGWISSHNRRRRALMASAGEVSARRTLFGLALLGFTSVYREGFEVVLFLQNLRLRYGSGAVAEGVAIGLILVAVIGVITFAVHRRLPYRRMLVVTGVMLAGVLLVMVGESVQELQQAGWIGAHSIGVSLPGWMGLWLAIFPTVEGLAAQGLAMLLVLGSYAVAEEMRVKRPRRRGQPAAVKPSAPPRVAVGAGVASSQQR